MNPFSRFVQLSPAQAQMQDACVKLITEASQSLTELSVAEAKEIGQLIGLSAGEASPMTQEQAISKLTDIKSEALLAQLNILEVAFTALWSE